MALTSTDERDLLVPLYGSITDAALWPEFAGKLRARLGGERLALLSQASDAAGPPRQHISAAWGVAHTGPLDIVALSAAGLIPYASLRPARVYALEEMLVRNNQDIDKQQKKLLKDQGFTFARFVRISGMTQTLWVIAVHDDRDFSGSDSALLSALAPHIAVALDAIHAREMLDLRAAIAEEALGLLGIRQMALTRDGDPLFAAAAPVRPGEEWAKAAAALSGAAPDERRILISADAQQKPAMLRPAPSLAPLLSPPAAATLSLRTDAPKNPQNSAKAIAALFGLSPREAALTEAICRGLSIIEAGASLRLTSETARNYSKRIYAKTGARGQADLVRMVLSSLAVLG